MSTTEAAAAGQHADLNGEALSAWLAKQADGFGAVHRIEKFPGGQSNPTYRVEGTSGRSLVLRRKPFGKLLPSAHAVDREFRLISALDPTPVPVPSPVAMCEDEDVIGVAFYVMEMVEGRVFWQGGLPELTRGERGTVYDQLVDNLAALHSVDIETAGLSDFGRPGNYFERQVGRWTKQYRAAQTDEIEEVERLIDYLPGTVPAQSRTSIIHGDYRLDNVIFGQDLQACAVIDWELSTIGDPLADFAYLAMNWAMPASERGAQLGGLDLDDLGIPSLEEVTARYCEKTGRDEVPALDWYFAYNLFRLVGILQGVKRRMLDGNASSAEAEKSAARIVPLAEHAWAFAERAGASR